MAAKEIKTLKADFNFDFIGIDEEIDKTVSVKTLVAGAIAMTKSAINPLTAFEWAMKIKKDGFLTFSSTEEYEKLKTLIEKEWEGGSPFFRGFILSELKKQNS